MLEQLRGRNLAHVGCTIGLTLGLVVGLLVGIAIIALVRTSDPTTLATIAWLAITFGLGLLGYILGGRTSKRLWGQSGESE